MKKAKIFLSFLLITVLALSFAACGEDQPKNTDTNTGTASSDAEVSVSSADSDVIPEPEPVVYYNPLTGLEAQRDTSGKRPLAVMVNNIKQSLPQEGISEADVVFECLVEGGITRLMALFSDYENLEVIGSIRSCRPYYLDFAQVYDAIYAHCGASTEGDAEIISRKINNINDSLSGTYYRDAERRKTMAYEHTLMGTGEGISKAIAYYKYRTDLREGYAYPFAFPEVDAKAPAGTTDALNVYIPMSNYQTVDYVYDFAAGVYFRYQYNGQPHMDSHTNTQLTFKNVILLYCKTTTIREGLLSITTTGTGDGIWISEGKATPITWSRDSRDGNLTLTDAATGAPLVINRGKTAVNVCPLSIQSAVKLNATDRTIHP